MNYKEAITKKYNLSDKINDYLSIKNDCLYLEDIPIIDLVKKYGDPLEIAYTDLITKRIKYLKECFNNSIKKYNYNNNFIYAYATKANYYSEVISTAKKSINTLELTSSYDTDIIEFMFNEGTINKKTLIICNGFKYDRYLQRIKELKAKGLNIIPIIENVEELKAFIDLNQKIEIGLRLTIDNKTLSMVESENRLSSKIDSRFGLSEKEILDSLGLIKNSKNIKLKILHFHLGGTIKNSKNYSNLIEKILKIYKKIKIKIDSLDIFNIGGGLPTQYSLDFNFDYQDFSDKIIKTILIFCKKNNIKPPAIIGEYGRYTVSDHSVFIFKVILKKKSASDKQCWYLLNGSLMNLLPDSWALGQDFVVLPINGWGRKAIKAKLGGITCDPDDTYYKEARKNWLYMPDLNEKEDLYIAFFGVGSYQEMISGVGGVHHCLLPEGNELIIYKDKGNIKFDKISKLQPVNKVLRILDYHSRHNINRYIK